VHLLSIDEAKPNPWWWPEFLGSLEQQREAWKLRHQADAIYAPCQTQIQLLSALRAWGLFHIPLLMIAHHPMTGGRLAGLRRWWASIQLRGLDACHALSHALADDLNSLTSCEGRSQALVWGPTLSYYPPPDGSPGDRAIAAGRTGRDFITFGRAATLAGVGADIICLSSDPATSFDTFGGTVRVTDSAREDALNYRSLIPRLQSARVHAIPLHPGHSLAGLTSLTDAIALGKPVIMTRHRLIDIDVESEGIGRFVDPGDVEGWRKALLWFDQNPAQAVAMGKRSRALAEHLWNDQTFASAIAAILGELSPPVLEASHHIPN
jgi:hypothetical protein